MARFPLWRRLSTRIAMVVMTTILGFLVILGISVNALMTEWIEDKALDSFSALASARQHAVEAQVSRYFDVASAFIALDLGYDVEELLASEGALAETRREALIVRMWRKLRADDLLESAQVVDLENRIVVQTHPGDGPYLDAGSDFFRKALLRAQLSVPILDVNKMYLAVAHPLVDSRGTTIALLVIKILADDLLEITGDYTGLGETGETVLSIRFGDEITSVMPLRFRPDLTQFDPLPVSGERAGPSIRATAGQTGVIRSIDYRGEPVMAAFRPVAPVGWGLVTKQDEWEVNSAVKELRNNISLLLLALLGLATATVLPILRAFTEPLRVLERATGEVISGKLDVHVPEPGDLETGALARAFNTMVLRVKMSQEELERRNQELGAFAHVVSHDLKAPLRGVASLSEWLQEDVGPNLDEENRSHLNMIRERVIRMNSLIDGLLDYAQAGRVKYPPISVDVERMLAAIVEELGPPDGISVEKMTPLPVLVAEEVRLRQVFQNLIDNAVKHHPGPVGKIEVSCAEKGPFWEFSISDDGDGIDSRHHDRIFQIFEKLGSGDDVDSTGIGLAITKKVLESVGGTIWVESEGVPGKGSTFHFTWPKEGKGEK